MVKITEELLEKADNELLRGVDNGFDYDTDAAWNMAISAYRDFLEDIVLANAKIKAN